MTSQPPFSAFCLAAAHSGSGKTTLAAGLLRVLTQQGFAAQGFKCGPDYVDPSFHAQASGRPACNLDTWMMGRTGVRQVFAAQSATADVAVCEGVMGLLDGRDVPHGEADGSTLDCAAALGLPLVLVVGARGMGASLAALVEGFVRHAEARGVRVAGVIANHTGSPRHTAMLEKALHDAKLPPLLGALPRDPTLTLPERQLGLIPAQEAGFAAILDRLATAVQSHVDVKGLLLATRLPRPVLSDGPATAAPFRGKLAIAKDDAFCFYYAANETALQRLGWELVPFSPLADATLPEADALYLGGGYPEVFAAQLAVNTTMLADIRAHAAAGKPIWAECGGYMLLCRELVATDGTRFPMTGVLDATAYMGDRLRSLGYREVRTVLPFGLSSGLSGGLPYDLSKSPVTIRGHEFHWSRIALHSPYAPLYEGESPELGVVSGSVQAGYVHLYWGECVLAECPLSDAPPPKMLHGSRVIVLNGPSSAGKTSLAHALRELLTQGGHRAIVISMDDFLRGCGQTTALAAEAAGIPVVKTCHAAVTEAARQGSVVIADHVAGDDPCWLPDLMRRLGGIPVHGVQVRCEPDELVRRENVRTDRPADPAHALRQHAHIHGPLPNEITADTTRTSSTACALQVFQAIF